MRRYESVVILDPELSDEDVQSFTDRYSGLIKEGGGEIIRVEDWGSKRLAYLVKKRDVGRYLLLDYVGLPTVLTEVERQFKISEQVMKFISVMLDDHVDLDAFKQQPPQEAPGTDEAPPEKAVAVPPETAEAQAPGPEPAEIPADAQAEAPAEPSEQPSGETPPAAPAEAAPEPPAEAPVDASAEPAPRAPGEAAEAQSTEPVSPEPDQAEPKAEAQDERASEETKKEGND